MQRLLKLLAQNLVFIWKTQAQNSISGKFIWSICRNVVQFLSLVYVHIMCLTETFMKMCAITVLNQIFGCSLCRHDHVNLRRLRPGTRRVIFRLGCPVDGSGPQVFRDGQPPSRWEFALSPRGLTGLGGS